MNENKSGLKKAVVGVAGVCLLALVVWFGYAYVSKNEVTKELIHTFTGKGDEMQPVEEGEVRLKMDEVAQLKPVSDYTEIYSVIKRFDKRYEGASWAPHIEVVGVSTAGENETTKQDEAAGENEATEKDESVEQGDVVASDGTYVCRIRSLSSKKVDIAKIEKDGKLVKGQVPDCDVPEELYVRDGMLILCSSIYTGTDGRDYTNIYFYDIRNPKEPKLLEQRCQTGYYCTSQIKDGYLYVVSYDKPYGYFEEGDAGTYVPRIDYEAMKEERIFRREGCVEYSYGVMTSIDLSAPEKFADVAAVWTGVTETAIGEDGIYFSNYDCTPSGVFESDSTELARCSIEDGKIRPVAMTKLCGNAFRQGTFGEYTDSVCVITGNEEQKVTHVYVLDKNLNQLADYKKLKGYVKSAAYTKDKAYIATKASGGYMYTFDMSDSTQTRLVAASDIKTTPKYLQVYDEDLLFGVGQNFKMVMYDVSDAEYVEETAEIKFGIGDMDDRPIEGKAVLLDREKNRIGIAVDVEGDRPELLEEGLAEHSHRNPMVKDGDYHVDYLLLSYDREKGFESVLTVPLHMGACDSRGVISDNILCVAALDNKGMFTYDLDAKQFVDRLYKK